MVHSHYHETCANTHLVSGEMYYVVAFLYQNGMGSPDPRNSLPSFSDISDSSMLCNNSFSQACLAEAITWRVRPQIVLWLDNYLS